VLNIGKIAVAPFCRISFTKQIIIYVLSEWNKRDVKAIYAFSEYLNI